MNQSYIQRFFGLALLLTIFLAIPSSTFAQFTTVWDRTGVNKPAWFGTGTERAIAYHNGKLYIASRGSGASIRIVNAKTGADISSLDASTLSGGTLAFTSLAVSEDGVIFASNLTINSSTSAFKVYQWDNDDDTTPVVAIDYLSTAADRLADNISVSGSVKDGTAVLYASAGTTPRVYRWVVQSDGNGGFSFPNAATTVQDVPNIGSWGTPAHANGLSGGNTSSYLAGGRSATFVRQYTAAGTNLGFIEFTSGNKNIGALSYQTFNNVEYLFTYHPGIRQVRWHVIAGSPGSTNTNRTGTDLGISSVIGTTADNINGDIAVKNNGDGTFTVFVLATTNGLIAFETSNVLTSGTNKRIVSGDAGWRMMALPATGVTVSDLASQNLIQGVSGGDYAAFAPNFFTGYTGGGSGWTTPASMSETIAPGRGFVWYMYNNTAVTGSVALPFTLNANGSEPDTDVTVSVNEEEYSLLGNPYRSSISVSAITGNGDFSGTVQVWKDGVGESAAGATSAGTWVLESSKIAPFQGFMLESETATSVTIPISAKSVGGVFMKSAPEYNLGFYLLSTDGGQRHLIDQSTNIRLSASAQTGWDSQDLTKLGSMDAVQGILYIAGERNGEPRAQAQISKPTDFDEITVFLDAVKYNGDGNFQMDWFGLDDMPADWSVVLIDRQTGEEVNMRNSNSHAFSIASAAKVSRNDENPLEVFSSSNPRFAVVIRNGSSTSIEPGVELPQGIALDQNYPNPFNPTTRISYQVPANGQVRLAVYDLLGREVAMLVDGPMLAGSHSVNFDASSLSSGVYIYRLTAGGQTLTRKMTLVK